MVWLALFVLLLIPPVFGPLVIKSFAYALRWVMLQDEQRTVSEKSYWPFTLDLPTVQAMLREWLSTIFTVSTYPLGFLFPPIAKALREPGHRPLIVLVHGYGINSACMFGLWLNLRKRGFRNIIVPNNRKKFGVIYTIAEYLNREIESVTNHEENEVYLIGHSMGGIILRQYLDTYPNPKMVAGVMTLASPHHGTKLAYLGRGVCSRQLSPGSEYLAHLNERKDGLKQYRFRSLFSAFDAFMVPWRTPILFEYRPEDELPLVGHNTFLWSPTVADLIAEEIRSCVGQPAEPEAEPVESQSPA